MMRKHASLLLFAVLTVSTLLMVKAALASASIPKPSVPEFTVKYVDKSYDVPPTYGIDPYTGKNVTTRDGYHVENFVIEVTIKNQPFPSVIDGNAASLYYNVRIKGHFAEDWTIYYDGDATNPDRPLLVASNSEYTVLSIPLYYPPEGQVDFQVQAIIGYHTEVWYSIPDTIVGGYVKVFKSEKSSWSDTQTVTIPPYIPPSSSSPQTLQLGIIMGVVIVVVVLLVYFRKRKRKLSP